MMISCRKDYTQADCTKLLLALQTENKELLENEINTVIHSLTLNHSALYNSQQEDMNMFIEKLNMCGSIDATLLCLWCVETLPPQTKISVKYVYGGVTITKVIDLIQESGYGFRFANVHD